MATKENLKGMKVGELRAELTKRGLDSTGLKAALISRLEEALDCEVQTNKQPAALANSSSAGPQAEDKDAVHDDQSAEEQAKHLKITYSEIHKPGPDLSKLKQVKLAAAATQQLQKKELSAEDKLKARAERFKLPSSLISSDKLKARAARFGIAHPEIEKEKLKKRAARFNLFDADLEKEKKKQRAQRFNVFDPDVEAEKKKQRADRFKPLKTSSIAKPLANVTILTTEERKKLRAERFKTQ